MEDILWVDSHCHPQYESLTFNCIKEAFDNFIARLCCVGTVTSEHDFLMQCKDQYKVAVAIGEHPLNDLNNIDWEYFESLLSNYHAIGEFGFDFQSDIKKQIEVFEIQAALAEKYRLPVILHIRDSGNGDIERLTIEQLKKFPNLKGVFHCFVGGKELADYAIENNFYVSFSGIVTFKKSDALREVLKTIPLTSLLIETDAPYLAPVPYRGKLNRPMYVKHVGIFIAEFLGLQELEFSKQLIQNFDNLFYGL